MTTASGSDSGPPKERQEEQREEKKKEKRRGKRKGAQRKEQNKEEQTPTTAAATAAPSQSQPPSASHRPPRESFPAATEVTHTHTHTHTHTLCELLQGSVWVAVSWKDWICWPEPWLCDSVGFSCGHGHTFHPY